MFSRVDRVYLEGYMSQKPISNYQLSARHILIGLCKGGINYLEALDKDLDELLNSRWRL
jgi:hypothetical protein